MKLATVKTSEGPRIAALHGDANHWVLLSDLHSQLRREDAPALGSMQSLIDAGEPALDLARELLTRSERDPVQATLVPRNQARLLAPIPVPRRLRCFTVYEKHMRQALDQVLGRRFGRFPLQLLKTLGVVRIPRRWYEVPAYYKGNHLSVVGPDHTVNRPSYSSMLDYELELAVILGKGGRNIARRNAMSHIFGYSVFNDFSARDTLIQEMGERPSTGPAKGKDFDGGNALGPWIVTADEISNPDDLAMSVRVNGELRGQARSGEMHHGIDAMIEYASREETLTPGEVFACGAVGDGTGIESWRFLKDGDVVELEIDRIGVLRNVIAVRSGRLG